MSIKIKGALLWIMVFQIMSYCMGMITQHDIVTCFQFRLGLA